MFGAFSLSAAMSLGLRGGVVGGAWTPNNLGADLLGWFDAEQSSTLALATSAVTAWTDAKSGTTLAQGTSAFRPIYGATSFNGRPGLTFDGTDDRMSVASVPYPIGSNAVEIWVLASQTSLPASGADRCAFAYGGASSATSRRLGRGITGGQNYARAYVGNGSTAAALTNLSVDLSGINVMRLEVTPTEHRLSVNGGAKTVSGAVVPGTTTGSTFIGATTGDAAFWRGVINSVIVTSSLSDAQAAQLLNHLKARGGIS